MRPVGLEPWDLALALARRKVLAAGMADRITLRSQRVEELRDEACFDVAWLPGNFLGASVYEAALATVHRALRPGGLVLMATLGGDGTDVASAGARLRATLWGGEPFEPERVLAMLMQAGYVDVRVLDRQLSGLTPIHAIRA